MTGGGSLTQKNKKMHVPVPLNFIGNSSSKLQKDCLKYLKNLIELIWK